MHFYYLFGLPWQPSGKEHTFQCRQPGFDPWIGKIPWKREWQPIPVFLPGKCHGQRSLADYSPRGHKGVGRDLVTKQQQQHPLRKISNLVTKDQICRWHHPHDREQRGTKEPLDEVERGEWKSWLKTQHSKNEDHDIWFHHFMVNRWGNNGNSESLYFLELQNHCR